jgi:hypothetical protein
MPKISEMNGFLLRFFFLAVLLEGLCLSMPAFAGEEQELSGSPIVQDSGTLVLNGRKIVLWGITTLDGDQQCWLGQRA